MTALTRLYGGFVEGGFGLLRDGRKRFRLMHGEVGEHLAVDLDPAFFRPLMNLL